MTRPKSITSKPPASQPGSEIKGFLLRSRQAAKKKRKFFSAKNDRTVGQTWASDAIKKNRMQMGDHYIYIFLFLLHLYVIGLGIENYKPSLFQCYWVQR